ncbi:hypothetical protein IFT72_01790 [Frigoribacterium sp. CFBP 8754]|uniref:hypothetical protein n=1 Tax=unclassified Frigoribacterium TaxID=2627005 RepID=UPI0006F764D4|nr:MULTISPECIES: hypothetical protein [unclassified Frigoribacterium]KQR46455.1 hypothetical protein ASF82_02945 [Frigoribacterium sp. Leaf164]MBD8658921.1 hypothetical protein [Frigoribacterium sp. CFBP 8754]
MSDRERTPQQVDPVGALASRPVSLITVVAALAVAVSATLSGRDEIVDPAASVGAVAALAAAGLVLVLSASPLRAPFRRRSLVAVVVLSCAAVALEALGLLGQNELVRDDWSSLAVGVLLLGVAPYRPAAEILVAGLVVAVVVAVVVLLERPWFVTAVPTTTFVVVAVVPVVALSAAAASFSRTFTLLVERWIDRATTFRRASADELRASIARSVQQDRVTILNRDVVPFFSSLVDRGAVTAADAQRARDIADQLRVSMVAEADRSWLEHLFVSPTSGVSGIVVDPDFVASAMTPDHRTSLRALLVAFGERDGVQADDVRVDLRRVDERVEALVSVPTTVGEFVVRRRFAPWFAVLRIVFGDLQVDATSPLLTLRFSYDQH